LKCFLSFPDLLLSDLSVDGATVCTRLSMNLSMTTLTNVGLLFSTFIALRQLAAALLFESSL
ncbi:hypothetical protein AB4424_24975, partial [Vibrio splendidus]